MPDVPPDWKPETKPKPRKPRPGDVLHLTRAASVQFLRPILVRVIRVLDWPTYDGWLWIDGYELAKNGDAVARRSVFVMPAGLIWPDPPARRPTSRTPVKRGPVRVG
ncbi:hypothetical protein LADH09A_003106 [Micromonospora sp. LAH09]|uniref:hypothetical protein n=1 Tax=Micromonospora cabrerizensis TaxID=2911213 RepID=UPI001EE993F4|nr:hypothetical protein [Micromonospora cabrerizensis]MCG5469198.1 hypothetical protein [Micromonospora cabrerizensis]